MSRQIKIIIAIIASLIIVAVIAGVYFALRNSGKKQQTQQSQIQNGQAAQNFQNQSNYQIQPKLSVAPRLKIISSQPVFDYWTSGDIFGSISNTISSSSLEKEIFYFNEQGQILKGDEIISDRELAGLQTIRPAKNGQMVLVEYGPLGYSPNNQIWEIFNVQTKVWQVLDNTLSADFSPDSKKLAYLDISGNLFIKNAAVAAATSSIKQRTARPQKILTINQKDFDLKWIADDKILLVSKPSANYVNEIWSVNLKNKTLSLFDRNRGLLINWAKDGSYGLDFSADQKGKGKLKLIDNSGGTKANLNFSTMPSKCAVTIDELYCAVYYAYSTVAAPFLPDDYLKRKVYFSDYLYEINIAQNSQKQIFGDANPVLDADKLSIFDNQLLFINRYDKKLYSLSL